MKSSDYLRSEIAWEIDRFKSNLSCLNEITEDERRRLQKAFVLAAAKGAIVRQGFNRTPWLASSLFVDFVVLCLTFLQSRIYAGRVPSIGSTVAFQVGVSVCFILLSISLSALPSRFPPLRLGVHGHIFDRASKGLFPFLLPAVLVATTRAALRPNKVSGLPYWVLLTGLIVMVLVPAPLVIRDISRWWTFRRTRQNGVPGIDWIMIHVLSIAADLARAQKDRRQATDRHLRDIVGRLETLAYSTTLNSPIRPRAPWSDPYSRKLSRLEGEKLASIIRSHKSAVLMTENPRDLAAVEKSLCSGLVAWEQKDWEALTENYQPTTPGWTWRSIWKRTWPALVLLGFGLVLPYFPAISATPTAASSLRITLIAAAVLALTTGGVSVADRVNESLTKALPWRPTKG